MQALTARPVQVVLWLLPPVLVVRGQTTGHFTFECYRGLFGLLVLNLSLTTSFIVSLRHRVLDYLGRISYGLYMLHSIAIVIALRAAELLAPPRQPLHRVVTCGLAVAVSIILAGTSFKYVETPFSAFEEALYPHQ